MKIALRIIIVSIIGFVIFGFYTNSVNEGEGEKFIGIGVLIFAFVLMPLFIYHRYNGRDLSRYSIKNMFQQIKNREDKTREKE